MKTFIALLAGILAMIGIFCLDGTLINYIISCIPISAVAWFGVIKVLLWVLAIMWTPVLAFYVGILVDWIFATILKS